MNNNIHKLLQTLNRNTPTILTAAGVTGTITTAYLAAKAGYKTAKRLEGEPPGWQDKELVKKKLLIVAPLYVPPTASAILTVSAIVFSGREHAKRVAAAVSAYTITERAFSEYKEHVIDEIGKHKEQTLRDDIVAKTIEANPHENKIIHIGEGKVLCCELYTKRYFMSDMETLRRAQNDVNEQIINDIYVSLDAFYDTIGLPHTSTSSEIGWDSNRLMELEFSTVLSEDGRPCLAFSYSYIKPL